MFSTGLALALALALARECSFRNSLPYLALPHLTLNPRLSQNTESVRAALELHLKSARRIFFFFFFVIF